MRRKPADKQIFLLNPKPRHINYSMCVPVCQIKQGGNNNE